MYIIEEQVHKCNYFVWDRMVYMAKKLGILKLDVAVSLLDFSLSGFIFQNPFLWKPEMNARFIFIIPH